MSAHLMDIVKATQAITIAAGAAGTAAINGTILDMQGFDGLAVVVQTGPIVAAAVTSMKVSQDDDSAMGSDNDIAGTKQTIADDDDNKAFMTDIIRPTKRYVRVKVSRATQNATVSAMYYQYKAKAVGVTQPSGVALEKFVDPAEGTA